MKPNSNIDADRIEQSRDWKEMTFVFRWYKDGLVMHELSISDDRVAEAESPFCPACLIHRGKLIEMSSRFNDQARCPECGGFYPLEGICTCGDVPHTDDCPMGYRALHYL